MMILPPKKQRQVVTAIHSLNHRRRLYLSLVLCFVKRFRLVGCWKEGGGWMEEEGRKEEKGQPPMRV